MGDIDRNTVQLVTGPLLAVDAPSLLYRAFFALPKSIKGPDGEPVNALLGMANLLLQAYDAHSPRTVVLCFGAEAAAYRVDAFPAYHADRPPMPPELERQWRDARAFFGAFGWSSLDAEPQQLEADDLLGALASVESDAGGEAVLFTGDRDMFQCVGERVRVLFPAKGGPESIGPDEVRERYGVEPGQVPDLIALRGDPSDGLPGAKGIGAKGAAELLRRFGTLEGVLDAAGRATSEMTPRTRGALTADPGMLRSFHDIATLRPIELARPADAPLDSVRAAAAALERGMGALAGRLEQRALAT
jgi:DNA polymerase-1